MNYPHFRLHDKVYFRKIDLLPTLKTLKDFNNVHYYFYDDVIKSTSWWKEPIESFDTLMSQRVFELKDKYSKLRLFLSGGYDSYLTFLYFLKNKVTLDEIVYIRTDFSETNDKLADVELYEQFYPLIYKYENQLKNTEIKVWSTPFSKIMNIDGAFNIHTISDNLNVFTASPQVCKYFHEKDFVTGHGNIWSDPKPTISMSQDGQIYYSVNSDENYQGDLDSVNNEFFFLSDTNCTLLLKMVHILKNYFLINGIQKNKSDGNDLVEALQIPYFNDWQASNLGKVYFTDNPLRIGFPFYRGKNYLRLQTAAKHEHSKHFFTMWKEYYIQNMKINPIFLNNQRTSFRPIFSNFYNLSTNEIIESPNFIFHPVHSNSYKLPTKFLIEQGLF